MDQPPDENVARRPTFRTIGELMDYVEKQAAKKLGEHEMAARRGAGN